MEANNFQLLCVTPFGNNNLKCQKCNNIPNFTIFNSANRVNISEECPNKHFHISLLDEYIKNIILIVI